MTLVEGKCLVSSQYPTKISSNVWLSLTPGIVYSEIMSKIITIPILVLSLVAATSSGCKNALSESAKKDTDKALFYQAQRLIDSQNYTDAVTVILSMTSEGRAKRDTKELLGSAYAGACGLDLISLASSIANMGTSTLFNAILSARKSGSATATEQCVLAEEAMLSISTTATSRNADENVLLSFIEFAKIGSLLATSADLDDDGTVDPAFDTCSTSAISDADIGQLGTGLTIALASIQASGSTAAGDATTTISNLCSQIDTVLQAALMDPTYSGFCDKTDATGWSAMELKALRSLTRSSEIGLKTCNNTIDNCLCP